MDYERLLGVTLLTLSIVLMSIINVGAAVIGNKDNLLKVLQRNIIMLIVYNIFTFMLVIQK